MNQTAVLKLRKGIAIALKQFPWLKEYDKVSGIYVWERYDEDEEYCWYIGKAKNILKRTAQHIMDGQSHLDKSIKKHKFIDNDNPHGWTIRILNTCEIPMLDHMEQCEISRFLGHGKTYNVESGGTTGKTIIGEKKQRRDIKWKAEARAKVLAEFREYFDIVPKGNAIKGKDELKVKAEALQQEYYNGQVSYDNDYWKIKTFLKEHGFNDLDELIARWENEF